MLRRAGLFALLGLAAAAQQGAEASATSPRWTIRLADRCPTSPSNLATAPGVYPISACNERQDLSIHGLQATRRGWVAYTSYGLEAVDEDGRVRWRVDNRSNCWRYYGQVECSPLVTDFAATPDGGAWQMEHHGFPGTTYRPDTLRKSAPMDRPARRSRWVRSRTSTGCDTG